MRDEVLADSDDQPRFCVAQRSDTKRGARGASLAPAVYARFWIDLAQSTGVPSWRRYLEPCPPLVRVFDYRLAGENHHHRTPSYDSTHRARSLHRRLCGPVAEKILPHRIERIPGGADRHHSLRRLNRHLHGQSLVCPCPSRRSGDGDVQSGADVVGAFDCPARAIHGRECAYSEHDQPGHHFRSGVERNRDRPVRFAGSALSERGHVFRGSALPRVGATGNPDSHLQDQRRPVVQRCKISGRG